MYSIAQNQTAQALIFLMVDAADMTTPETGLSPTVTLSKNGGAFGAPAGAVTEIGSGWYKVAGNATDADTLGPLALHATAAGAAVTDAVFPVVAYNPLDGDDLGLTTIDTEIAAIKARTDALPTDPADASDIAASLTTITGHIDTEIASILAAVDTEVAAIKAKTDNLPASPAAVGSTMVIDLTTALDQTPVSASVGHALLAALVEAYGDEDIAGTTYVKKNPDGSTFVTFTLDSATDPTERVRS